MKLPYIIWNFLYNSLSKIKIKKYYEESKNFRRVKSPVAVRHRCGGQLVQFCLEVKFEKSLGERAPKFVCTPIYTLEKL